MEHLCKLRVLQWTWALWDPQWTGLRVDTIQPRWSNYGLISDPCVAGNQYSENIVFDFSLVLVRSNGGRGSTIRQWFALPYWHKNFIAEYHFAMKSGSAVRFLKSSEKWATNAEKYVESIISAPWRWQLEEHRVFPSSFVCESNWSVPSTVTWLRNDMSYNSLMSESSSYLSVLIAMCL